MLGTVLGLELLLREPCLDLRMVSEIVLSDVGATIRILGLVGREGDLGAGQPRRMGECLASLDVGVWFNVISARTFASDREHSKMTAVWKHCRLVAQYAQLVAESLEGISADEAYLVGLLHEIGAIATVLEWPKDCPGRRDPAALLAMDWPVPARNSTNMLSKPSTPSVSVPVGRDFFLSHSAVVRMRQQRMDGAPAKWRNADCEVTSHILTLT